MSDAKRQNSTTAPPRVRRATIPIEHLRRHHEGCETQLRVETDGATVQRYAERMSEGETFPPVCAVEVGDGSYYLVDGWHRVAAIEMLRERDRRRKATVAAEVHQVPAGAKPLDHALRLALAQNTKHGLPLSTRDQLRRAAKALLLPEFARASLRKVASAIGVSKSTVARAKARLLAEGKLDEEETGEPLPAFVPERYALVHRRGQLGHALRWDRELRQEVFGFVGQLKPKGDPRAWTYDYKDAPTNDDGDLGDGDDDEEGMTASHWDGQVEHHGLIPGKVVSFSPFENIVTNDGLPKLRRIIDPSRERTPEQIDRYAAMQGQAEMDAARIRLEKHPDPAVPAAVATLRRYIQHDDFRDDLWLTFPRLFHSEF